MLARLLPTARRLARKLATFIMGSARTRSAVTAWCGSRRRVCHDRDLREPLSRSGVAVVDPASKRKSGGADSVYIRIRPSKGHGNDVRSFIINRGYFLREISPGAGPAAAAGCAVSQCRPKRTSPREKVVPPVPPPQPLAPQARLRPLVAPLVLAPAAWLAGPTVAGMSALTRL